MDHQCAQIGRFSAGNCASIIHRFGFYGVQHDGRAYMYMHGLVPSPEFQQREELLHCAAYVMEERAPDDPWSALKRLLHGKSENVFFDLAAVASSPGLLAKGGGMRLLQNSATPSWLKRTITNAAIRLNPNFVAREFQSRGLPHKLTGATIDGIVEQRPDPAKRITLSDRRDALGVPLARINWRIDQEAMRSLLRLGRVLAGAFPDAGLPKPIVPDWIAEERLDDGIAIDMGHTLGTTRMSDDPKQGVVDAQCRVHGISGLYVAGGSVFPTSGHANPTLMIVALAIRLADQIKAELAGRR
jgi:choline dehydrogenase-like flavoprotein